ncbi:MAG: HEPN domain-containing protein [Candidatus Methanomethylicaceae archaeon]|nr:HEPN domain-containing protein [Candidatus Verstraetearchaeota archaeon]
MLQISESFLRQAYARLKDAEDALKDNLNPYALRLSQECVELSLKAALKLVGIEYPKKHDVSRPLIDAKSRFPEWFQSEIEFMAHVSRTLAKKREISMYGDDASFLSPDELVTREEASKAVEQAKRVYELSSKLLSEIRSKT